MSRDKENDDMLKFEDIPQDRIEETRVVQGTDVGVARLRAEPNAFAQAFIAQGVAELTRITTEKDDEGLAHLAAATMQVYARALFAFAVIGARGDSTTAHLVAMDMHQSNVSAALADVQVNIERFYEDLRRREAAKV